MGEIITKGALAIVVACLIAALVALPVMWLWNYVMPYIFKLPELDFYHALAVSFLCSLLFKDSSSSSKD
jgi:hypothetical protein